MKKISTFIIAFIIFTEFSYSEFSDDLYIYGAAQTIFLNENFQQSFSQNQLQQGGIIGQRIDSQDTSFNKNRNSFMTQQVNLFVNKFYEDKLNFFFDMQFNQNYNSSEDLGSFSIQEAWVNYKLSNQFQIKAGQLFPAFNNLNEVKNRLNLLNYLFRPIVYEKILSDVISSEDFIPETAFLQLHGQIPISNFFIDWAAYMGNSEGSFLISNTSPSSDGYLSGSDPNDLEKKLYGARIGLRTKKENFKIGVSGTRDYNDGNSYLKILKLDLVNDYPVLPIEDQLRYRIGADLSANYKGFSIESEYSFSHMEDIIFKNSEFNIYSSDECWNRFYYVNLSYDINDDIFTYIGYSEILIGILNFNSDSDYVTLGAGYRINPWLTLKAQFIAYQQQVDYPILWENPQGERRPRLQTMKLKNSITIVGFSAQF
ncbi:porin [Candidatus Kapabacteria bacterium]|nr:porin [Candidatus Kapabacteria bacterium]